MAYSQNSKVQRYKYYLTILFKLYEPKCFFCKKKLDSSQFYPSVSGQHIDPFMVHHKNHNHNDNRKSNLSFAHRSCHAEHHWKERR